MCYVHLELVAATFSLLNGILHNLLVAFILSRHDLVSSDSQPGLVKAFFFCLCRDESLRKENNSGFRMVEIFIRDLEENSKSREAPGH